jgi:acetate kinase
MDLARLSIPSRPMKILVLNPGSSSLKASLIEQPGDRTLKRVERDWGGDATQRAGRDDDLSGVLDELRGTDFPLAAVGYRVVHGGSRFVEAAAVDDDVLAALRQLDDLAPLHNAVAANTIEAGRRQLPDVPHVACFDTAFHAGLPETARRYPLPEAWHADWGIRRYGFHGLSVAWSVERAAALLNRPVQDLHLVVAHLGSGCSATAVAGGRSVDTSMGMTPLEGLMMGTRSGSIDPGVLLHLLDAGRVTVDEIVEVIAHRSGLLGVSGRSASVRELEEAADAGDARAQLALQMFARRAAAGIAAVATALDRLDTLVFTGGVGEHAHRMRIRICGYLSVLGAPEPGEPPGDSDAVIGMRGDLAVLRVSSREDVVIARHVAAAVG